jgi:hypothetical protein
VKKPRQSARPVPDAPSGHAGGELSPLEGPASLPQVQGLFSDATAREAGLTLLKGFRLDFSGNSDFHKVFFSASCDCGTAALLSMEVSRSKTLSQVQEVLPGLLEHLRSKVAQFRGMSCQMHSLMRTGGRGDSGVRWDTRRGAGDPA